MIDNNKQINEICALIKQISKKFPHLRFGQILMDSFINNFTTHDLYYFDNEILIKNLKEFDKFLDRQIKKTALGKKQCGK
jgi:hypothetical protein